jgi:YYY domain-containing protein
MSWALQRPWFPTREPPQPTLLLDTPVGENPSVDDARWSAAGTNHTAVAVAVWIVLMLVLLLVGLPLARWLLPGFPDRGWGLARVFALTVAAYPVWLGASLQLFRFRAAWVVAALLMLGAIGWLLQRRHAASVDPRPTPAGPRLWVHAEVVFWLVLAMFLAFRFMVPDGWHPFWGGEKPMEFALINAISRSAFFPPYDPWFADGYVNYYYYGFYLVSFLFKATGIPAEIGFNLALPTVMAMLAGGGFSVAAALARQLTRSSRLAVVAGWSGAIALSLLGNLTAIRGIVDGGALRGDPFIFWTWNGSRAIDNAITEFPFFSGLYADLHSHVIALPLTVAVIALCLAVATNSFPARATQSPSSIVNAARLGALALLLGSLSATNAWDVPVYAALVVASGVLATAGLLPITRRVLTVALASLGVGGGAWLLFLPFHSNFVALFGSLAIVRDPTDLLQFLSHLGGLLAICAIGLTALLLRPYSGANGTPALGLLHVWPWLALVAVTLGLLALTQEPTAWIAAIGKILIVAAFTAPPLAAAWLHGSTMARFIPSPGWLPRIALIVAAIIALVNILSGRAVFALLFLLGAAAGAGCLGLRRHGERFACLLMAAGCFTAAGAEIVVVADDLIETTAYRMNTIFKFYNQVWVLLAIAGSGFLAVMLSDVIRAARRRPSPVTRAPGRIAWSRLGVTVATLVLVSGLAYPALATGPRLAQRFSPGTPSATLDALRWMEQGTVSSSAENDPTIDYAGDGAAIAWLLANVSGTPVIAEASIGPYRCNGSRISAATGLPTIIGWERHQQQQRYPESLPVRVEDVRRLYTSTDPAEKTSILRRYNVEFVVVGDLERHYPIPDNDCTPHGSPAGIAAFDEMIGETLEVAFASAGTTLYRVLPVSA